MKYILFPLINALIFYKLNGLQQGLFPQHLQNSEQPIPLNLQRQDLSREHLMQVQGDGKSSGKMFSFDTTIGVYESSCKQ